MVASRAARVSARTSEAYRQGVGAPFRVDAELQAYLGRTKKTPASKS